VVERTDANRRGKGFALDCGVRFLEKTPPEVVVIIDADCRIAADALGRVVREAAKSGRPVQAAYLLDAAPGAGSRERLSALAFLYKNLVRPLGLVRLGIPSLLTGSGMAFPWAVLSSVDMGSGNIVEDMKLGIDLAIAGHAPKFCPTAQVGGDLPVSRRAAVTQRTRWEHGHLQTLLTQVPRLIGAAMRQQRPGLLGLALELSVPPLSILFLLWAVAGAAAVGGWALGGSALPAIVLAGAGLAILLAIFVAWAKFGRERVPAASLLAAPFYILWKVPIYVAFIFRPQRAWVRTARAVPPPPESPANP
jgi:cellulose synthase/poly-beta-1,6-N-acetylglucosamine synthase-like glycosyltransferase